MANTAFKSYADEHGGRVLVLFLLFLLALYEFYSAGFGMFAAVCLTPVLVIFTLTTFRYHMFIFWLLFGLNYIIQMKNLTLPVPMSLPNEMLEILLIALAIINVKDSYFERAGNMMLFALLLWCGFCTLEVLNDTCNLGINVGAWYTGARLMAFQLLYCFIVFSLYISTAKTLNTYLIVWGCLALFAVIWVWKQQYIGFTQAESLWINTRGFSTHIINGGTLTRYFSIYGDAANYGIGIASTGVAFVIFGITAKVRRYKYFFLLTGVACIWGMFPSGTRTALACLMAGFLTYIFLSKSIKIAIPFTIVFTLFVFMLAFTNIGNGNQQIRRMRSMFNRNDASAGARADNQKTMRKYMGEAPWGIGLGMGMDNVPANNKYNKMATIPPDSEYVFIWLRTGIIGLTLFLITTAIMLGFACRIVLFTLRSPSLRGVGAGLCCAFVSQQLGGYGNQVLMQFPNCLVFYGGLTIVYILPYIEDEWIANETRLLAAQNERRKRGKS